MQSGPPSSPSPHEIDLDRWLADARADEAARRRAAERWAAQRSSEEATLTGSLLDLSERRSPVLVVTVSGGRHRGLVTGVSPDFFILRTDQGQLGLVRSSAVSAVVPHTAARETAGNRATGVDVLLREALLAASSDRPRVQVVSDGASEPIVGQLRSVGDDVVTIRTDASEYATAIVATSRIAEVWFTS